MLKNKKNIIILGFLGILLIFIIGFIIFNNHSIKNNFKNQNIENNEIIENNAKLTEEKFLTPEEKFEGAEIIEIRDEEHNIALEEIEKVIELAFTKTKITGYTKGYMGMNSGSGIGQITINKKLSELDVDILNDLLNTQGFYIDQIEKQPTFAKIFTIKNNYNYQISFNYDEQEIMIIIEAGK